MLINSSSMLYPSHVHKNNAYLMLRSYLKEKILALGSNLIRRCSEDAKPGWK